MRSARRRQFQEVVYGARALSNSEISLSCCSCCLLLPACRLHTAYYSVREDDDASSCSFDQCTPLLPCESARTSGGATSGSSSSTELLGHRHHRCCAHGHASQGGSHRNCNSHGSVEPPRALDGMGRGAQQRCVEAAAAAGARGGAGAVLGAVQRARRLAALPALLDLGHHHARRQDPQRRHHRPRRPRQDHAGR